MVTSFNDPLFQLSGRWVTLGEVTLVAGVCGLLLLVVLFVLLLRLSRGRAATQAAAEAHARELEAQLGAMLKTQAEMTGRMQTMAEVFSTRQSDMMRGVNERLDGMGHKLGQTMATTTQNTQEGLRTLHERLVVIDRAQKNITDLSGQVVELQHILSNKQTRGAFGQGRMEAIVQDALPNGAYAFQAALTNNSRPDCIIHMPGDAHPLVIDAKFPLEAFNRIRDAQDAEDRKIAQTQFRRDIAKHVADIRERYLIAGETQDTAFMFVPSESIFAELHENFDDLVQKAHRARIVIVSPSLLMLSIQVIQSILKDARMRELAHVVQEEVRTMLGDVDRLDERVLKLQQHFGQANKDIEQILISSGKISKRGQRIEALELGEETGDAADHGESLDGSSDDEVMRAPLLPLSRGS
ncbi:DNA recombination protein RmuC [Breoghania sp. L-A4]|uniref:DNA recombination protein RmuC n=1 Tax=Breoghania sp. L-A4 TaxID=2304600 RepID=UPI000E35EF5D|nr:DNA recombination protein RmuC [Breoghania sp. L-A4]AXS39107.1 DNA recombination protein RmuC [Breoghania sp. L-A4]